MHLLLDLSTWEGIPSGWSLILQIVPPMWQLVGPLHQGAMFRLWLETHSLFSRAVRSAGLEGDHLPTAVFPHLHSMSCQEGNGSNVTSGLTIIRAEVLAFTKIYIVKL